MQEKKQKTSAAVRRAAAILEEHFATLPKRQETKARKNSIDSLPLSPAALAEEPHDLSEVLRTVVQSALAQELLELPVP